MFGYSPKRLQVALASRGSQPVAVCVYGLTSARTTLISYLAGAADASPREWFSPLLRYVARHGTILYTWRPQRHELGQLYHSFGFRRSRLGPASLRQPVPMIARSDSGEVNGIRWTDADQFDLQPLMQD